MFLGLSRIPPHERSWGGARNKPKNVCVGGYQHVGLIGGEQRLTDKLRVALLSLRISTKPCI